MIPGFVSLLSISWLRLNRTRLALLLVEIQFMLSVTSRCAMTDNSTLKELTCDQNVLFCVVYVNAIRGIRFLVPLLINCFYHTIIIFAQNVTEVNVRIEPGPISMQRAMIGFMLVLNIGSLLSAI